MNRKNIVSTFIIVLLSFSVLAGCGSSEHKHNYVKINEVAPTCVSFGVEEHYACSGCDLVFDLSQNKTTLEQLKINPLDHKYDDGVITKTPTCANPGIKTFTCLRSGCGHVKNEEVKALNHDYDSGVITKAPTCSEAGIKTYTCQRPGCGHVENEVIKATGHTYDEGVVLKAPTCYESGKILYTCQTLGCGHIKIDTLERLEHDYDYNNPEIIVTPTYIKAGLSHANCKRAGCSAYEEIVVEPERHIIREDKKTLRMLNDNLKVVNFADIQLENLDQIAVGSITRVTVETMLEQEKPDIVTFSGDIVNWQNATQLYKALCDLMDTYKIPYYMIFGNHDRAVTSATDLAKIVNASEYGFMEKGPDMEDTYGNYVLDIKNKNGELVHKIFMMDSRSSYQAIEEDFEYVTDPVDGVKYNTHNDLKIYGHEKYDNIKGSQITWYEEQLSNFDHESTLITHIPLKQYIYGYEDYKIAVKNDDKAKIAAMSPIGTMRQYEAVCSSPFDSGLFDKMVELGSTKNFISCHDHCNDFSFIYEGIRLTYGVKCGNGCYWVNDGSMNGCTTLTINSGGNATVNQVYLDLVP